MSIFLSFFGIPPNKFLLDNLLYLIPFFMPFIQSPKHSQCIKLLQYFYGPYFLAKFGLFWVLTVLFAGWADSFIQTRTVYYSVPHENQSLSVFHRHFPIENCPGHILTGATLIYYTGPLDLLMIPTVYKLLSVNFVTL